MATGEMAAAGAYGSTTIPITPSGEAWGGMTIALTPASAGASAPVVTARETVDADADGQIDHIRMVTDQNLDDDFSGLSISVAGYTVSGYTTNIGAGGVNDNTFYVQLTESGTPDTGATPMVEITASGASRAYSAPRRRSMSGGSG